MPIGPYETFSDCVTAQQNKGKTAEQAKKICGELEQRAQGSSSVIVNNNNNDKFYVRAFLIDDALNLNQWKVTKESIEKNINTFIGKPLVLNEQFDHPDSHPDNPNKPETLQHFLAFQESFRVGTIIDIVKKVNPLTGSNSYHAIIEVTNKDLQQALRDNTVPLYVSPSIGQRVPVSATNNLTTYESQQSLEAATRIVSDWTAFHLAIVDQPAFGIKKAVITDQCGGSEEGCLYQLRKAHIEKHGIGNCGFCVKKALSKYKTMHEMALYRSKNAAANSRENIISSHPSQTASNSTGKQNSMSQLESIENTNATNPNSTSNTNTIADNVSKGFEKPNIPNTNPNNTRQAVQTPSRNNNNLPESLNTNIQELYAENQTLKQQIQLKDLKIEELTNITDTYNQRIANLETEKRIEKIQAIITPDVIRDEKLRLEKINKLVASNIPIDQIEELYKDHKILLRKASVNQPRRAGIPYGGAAASTTVGTSGIVTSNNTNTVTNSGPIVDEETGLTTLQKQLAVLRGGP